MSKLIGSRLDVRLLLGNLLLRSRPGSDAAWAVEAGAIHNGGVIDHGTVDIDIAHHAGVYVHNRGVIAKRSAGPITASETNTTVAESVVDAAVETDVRAPIAGVPSINAAAKTPVSRSP